MENILSCIFFFGCLKLDEIHILKTSISFIQMVLGDGKERCLTFFFSPVETMTGRLYGVSWYWVTLNGI